MGSTSRAMRMRTNEWATIVMRNYVILQRMMMMMMMMNQECVRWSKE